MSNIRNRPSALARAVVDSLRASLDGFIADYNTDLQIEEAGYRLPSFEDPAAQIDTGLMTQDMPDVSRPLVNVVVGAGAAVLASPPTLQDQQVSVSVRWTLAFEHLTIESAERVQTKEAALSGALEDCLEILRRCLVRLVDNGGIWGAVGVDAVDVVAAQSGVQAVPAEGRGTILFGAADLALLCNQEGLA